ncbi:EscU/YscU/HrcU family type III secretion system export apparatus switch protein [bacterium]|nr:EscU/YscU/HrcU family type III secretion system export apparatus switch protein [bacterium]
MSDERTEEATPQRMREARGRGQAPRSQEWASSCSMFMVLVALSAIWPSLSSSLHMGVAYALTHLHDSPGHRLSTLAWGCVAALLLASLAGSLLAQWVSAGWLWTWHPVKPDWQRLNPAENAKRWFSGKVLIDALRLAIKLGGILWLTWGFVHDHLALDAATGNPLALFQEHLWHWLRQVACFYVLVGALDLLYQRWEFHRGLRMSKHDVKQEYRQSEGDPQRKWRIRSLGQKLIKQRSLQGVAKASVIITNPTHLAVALEFNFNMPAPRVVAKGADQVALTIRKMAKKHQIPVVENKPLARALYPLEVDDIIPYEFFAPVAEILVAVARAEQN